MTRLIGHSLADGCAITMLFRGRPVTVASSSEPAILNDELQYTSDAGPCLQAMRSQTVVECPDLAEETRWGGYPAAALGCGMRAVLALPFDAAGADPGALNLYFHTPRGFCADDRRRGLEFAAIATAIVVASRTLPRSGAAEAWNRALAGRTAVAHAVGILMARNACDREEAFKSLVSASREHGEDIHTAAERIGAGVNMGD